MTTSTATATPTSSTLRRRRSSRDPSVPPPSSDDPSAKTKSKTKPPQLHFSPPLPVSLTLLDVAIALTLLLSALAVRMYRLAAIQSVIFDEVHYLNFDSFILQRKYFFDVNPVFGKLVIAFFARALGYKPLPAFQTLGQPLTEAQAFAARMPSALFGALTVPVFYRVCRLLRLSTFASVTGAMFILLDMMHVIQSRITMVDSVLVFFTCLAFYSALLLWDAKNVVTIKRRSVTFMDTVIVLVFLISTGIFCGLSVSVRWTAFATPMLIFVISFFGVGPFCIEPLNVLELAVLYGSAFASYVGSFAVFLLQVSHTGNGDNFMSKEFQSCLIGNQHYTANQVCKMSMWARIVEVNKTIFAYSKGIRGNDKWGSSWFQWIVNWRGALYYRQAAEGSNDMSLIYVLMNPVMTFCINLLMCLFTAALFYQVRYRKHIKTTDAFKQHLRRGAALFFGWIGSMLPTMVVYRSGPVYQYLPGLFFAQALGALGFDLIPPKVRPGAAILISTAIVVAFVYWSPWVYGVSMPHSAHVARRWLPRWD